MMQLEMSVFDPSAATGTTKQNIYALIWPIPYITWQHGDIHKTEIA